MLVQLRDILVVTSVLQKSMVLDNVMALLPPTLVRSITDHHLILQHDLQMLNQTNAKSTQTGLLS